MRILLAGGGSGGPVAPLIAVAEEFKKSRPKAVFLLVGTKNGPEGQMAKSAGIDFDALITGKWRRYWSWQNVAAPFLTFAGLIQAFFILRRFKPDCVFGAGSFVQVPVVWAAWILSIPCVIHQQDIYASLSNRLCEPFAKKITVCFEKSLTDFSSNLGLFYKRRAEEKVILTGNPFREELEGESREQALKNLKLRSDMPVLLVLGGGTGSDFINRLIIESLPQLARTAQVIHSWGVRNPGKIVHENYRAYDFIADMASAYAAADIVISRAGLSTLTELANLGKVSIIIPMPDSHQEYNAFMLDSLRAALVIKQDRATPELLIQIIRKLLFDHKLQQTLKLNISGIMPKDSAKKIAQIIINVIDRRRKPQVLA